MEAVRVVHQAAFPTDAEARLVDLLRANGRASVSLVADLDTAVVGHVLFSPVSVESVIVDVSGVGLAPLAVLPEHQQHGIGSRLVESGIRACRRAGFGFVTVLGDPQYYHRFGFQRALAVGLANEYGVDDEFMVVELRPGLLSNLRGRVRYGPEFSIL
jgi:putative acetyltransferase